MLETRKGALANRRAYMKLSAAVIAVAACLGGAGARADGIRSMDYMTEPTSNVAIQKSIDACVKQTGLAVERPLGALCRDGAAGPARRLDDDLCPTSPTSTIPTSPSLPLRAFSHPSPMSAFARRFRAGSAGARQL